MDDKIREEFEKGKSEHILRKGINGNYILLEMQLRYETYKTCYKSRDEEIKKLKDALKDRIGVYYERDVPHQSQIPVCRCRKCVDSRIKEALKETNNA